VETIVLASASPRRSELLSRTRLPFVRIPSAVDEQSIAGSPNEHARFLAQKKATSVLAHILERKADARADAVSADLLIVSRILDGARVWVVGADTAIDLDGSILGKPADEAAARKMIQSLSGRTHYVVTGICVLRWDGAEPESSIATERTAVRFGDLASDEIEAYVATGEWSDAAGGYQIQSMGESLVERIEGSYSNVVGLPLRRFRAMLRQQGYFHQE